MLAFTDARHQRRRTGTDPVHSTTVTPTREFRPAEIRHLRCGGPRLSDGHHDRCPTVVDCQVFVLAIPLGQAMMHLTSNYTSMRVATSTEAETTQDHRDETDTDGQEGAL